MQNYYAISPIKAYVKSSQVLLEEAVKAPYLPCHIIGICLYKDEALTFLIKLGDGEVFSYIPITALRWKIKKEKNYTLDELVYVNSPSSQISISEIDTLKGEISCYIKQRDKWLKGTYLLTIDFHEDNELCNFVKLNNGHFALLPFHKMKFKERRKIKKSFKQYKKQRETYIISPNKSSQ